MTGLTISIFNISSEAMNDHTIVMKAIHLDGVNFFRTRLLGTSDRR